MNPITSSFKALSPSLQLNLVKQDENSLRRGGNDEIAGMLEAGETYCALEILSSALNAAKCRTLTRVLPWTVLALPIGVLFANLGSKLINKEIHGRYEIARDNLSKQQQAERALHHDANELAQLDRAYETVFSYLQQGEDKELSSILRKQRVFHFILDHFGTLCQVASIVSSIALIYFGSTVMGITSLSAIVIGLLHQKGIFPHDVRVIVGTLTTPLAIFSSLFFGSIFDKIFAVVELTGSFTNWFLRITKTPPITTLPKRALTAEICKAYLASRALPSNKRPFELVVDRDYVRYTPFLPAPEIDIWTICKQFDTIQWTPGDYSSLRKKLKKDSRAKRVQLKVDQFKDEELKEIARKLLNKLITSVVEKKIYDGEPKDYDRLEYYLKFIAQAVQGDVNKKEDRANKVDILIKLAVDGGEYCGSGIFNSIEETYNLIVRNIKNLTPQEKIIYCLQNARSEEIEKMLYAAVVATNQNNGGARIQRNHGASSPQQPRPPGLLDLTDVHFANTLFDILGEPLYLGRSSTENEAFEFIAPLKKLLLKNTLGQLYQIIFWYKLHTSDKIIEVINDDAGTGRLPNNLVYGWCENWVQQLPTQTEEQRQQRQQLFDELTNIPPTLFGHPIYENSRNVVDINMKPHPDIVRLMLFDMGVLKAE